MKTLIQIKTDNFYLADNASIVQLVKKTGIPCVGIFVDKIGIAEAKFDHFYKTSNLFDHFYQNNKVRIFREEYVIYIGSFYKEIYDCPTRCHYYSEGRHSSTKTDIYYLIYSMKPITNEGFEKISLKEYPDIKKFIDPLRSVLFPR